MAAYRAVLKLGVSTFGYIAVGSTGRTTALVALGADRVILPGKFDKGFIHVANVFDSCLGTHHLFPGNLSRMMFTILRTKTHQIQSGLVDLHRWHR